jgi:pyruvate/2-oxoglutarate dehydrogenase complex dihydrolipoamide dehydrogenase (E3) component
MSSSHAALDEELTAHVHPPDWVNPLPAARYHLVVIGGGTAGLVAAAGAAGLGARVALVERHLLGGDCLNTGCVPSKTLISGARARLPFGEAMARVHRARLALAPHDSAHRFRGLGVDVFFGHARFTDPDTVVVDGRRLRFARAVIATGARPAMPPIPGLADAAPLTTETVFERSAVPRRLCIIGGGPVGCELAQAFGRFGVGVVLINDLPRLLEREDTDASLVVEQALRRDGVRIVLGAHIVRVDVRESVRAIAYQADGRTDVAEVEQILVSAGRTPNVDGLNLEAANVSTTESGAVRVDDFLRTTNRRVYACGDVCLPWKFTHAADASARIVVQNALFALGPLGRRRVSELTMSWCTYTDPEVAHAGLSEREAGERGIAIDTYTQPLSSLDRAVTDGATDGFVKLHVRRGTGALVGATIVAPRAGDIIGEVSIAVAGRIPLGAIANAIHPYPTYAEAIRKCGDLYNRTRVTPHVKALSRWWLGLRHS